MCIFVHHDIRFNLVILNGNLDFLTGCSAAILIALSSMPAISPPCLIRRFVIFQTDAVECPISGRDFLAPPDLSQADSSCSIAAAIAVLMIHG
jgi:hypothetical protein